MNTKRSSNQGESIQSLYCDQLLGHGDVQDAWNQHRHALERAIGSVTGQKVSGKILPNAPKTTEETTFSAPMLRSRTARASPPAPGPHVRGALTRGMLLVRSRFVPGAFRRLGSSRSARTSWRSSLTLPRVGGLASRVMRHRAYEVPYRVMVLQ